MRRHCGNHQETRVYAVLVTCSMSRRPSCATSPKPRRRRPSPKRLRGTASGARRCAAGSRAAGMSAMTRRGQPARLDPRAVDAAMRGEVVPATEGVPVVVAMADYLRRGVARAAAPTTPEYAPPVRAGDGADEVADAGGNAPVVTDLDTRYSALCDAVRAPPTCPRTCARRSPRRGTSRASPTRRAPTLHGDLATLRRAWGCVRARGELWSCTRRRGGRARATCASNGRARAVVQPRHHRRRAMERSDVGRRGGALE